MAKHTITVQANGMTYKVETDADTFMIGGVEFKFSSPAAPTGSITSRATFLGAQATAKKIACIKAVREASWRHESGDVNLTVREAKELVEACGTFEIFPESKARFEAVCREHDLTPTYV
jgi:ribosomal protein L7/L12